MGKLHQLVACEQDLAKQANNIMEETVTTFTKKSDHFDGFQIIYAPFDKDGEELADEVKNIITTVDEKLEYTNTSFVKALNATLAKEETNSSGNAKAELKVNGVSFGTFSSTSLIALERYLVKYRDMLKTVPTYDPTRLWSKSDTSGKMLYVAPPENRFRSMKVKKVLQLTPATDKFPPTSTVHDDTTNVGKYTTNYQSGKYSPLDKSKILSKVDELILEVKSTREKANETEVIDVSIGKELINFIMN